VLGRESVNVADNFFACGGHSLLCVRLLAVIEREFGCDLPIGALIHAPTLAQQAQLLRERAAVDAAPPLVRLRDGGSGQPLFCLHPVGGNVLCYLELARRIEADRPIYGIPSPALEGGPEPGGIGAMAAAYLTTIRAIQPTGPYFLAGWSLGGVIAFEMAQRLRFDGEAVQLLALIESYHPRVLEAIDAQFAPAGTGDREQRLLIAFARDLLGGNGEAPLPDLRSGLTLDEFLASPRVEALLHGISPTQRRRLFDVFKANAEAMPGYEPQPYDGHITLFGAMQIPLPDVTRGWSAVAKGGLTLHQLPGDHYSILKPPQVESLASILAAGLRCSS
jgi:thioesterase domain-containing protein/aryl carrier-like protein